MTTFNGDANYKTSVIERATAIGSRLRQRKETARYGLTLTGSKACNTGCTKSGCDHRFYASDLGVPPQIAFAEHALFLELPVRAAAKWPRRFVKALPVGVNEETIALVWRKFALYVLRDKKHGLLSFATTQEERAAIGQIVELFETSCLDRQKWDEAAKAAHTAHTRSPYRNNRMDGPDALKHAGCSASYAAAHLAWSFATPAEALEAIRWAAWCARYKRYGLHMMPVPDSTVKADQQGNVSIGSLLLDSRRWIDESERGEYLGERERMKAYERYADRLVQLLSDCVPRAGIWRYLRLPEFMQA